MRFNLQKNFPLLLFASGLLVWLVSAFFSEGYYQADEHYQVLEFAAYKLGHSAASDLAWEFGARIRPGFQPLIAYCMIKLFNAIGVSNPFDQAMIMRVLTALSAFMIVVFFCTRVLKNLPTQHSKWFLVFLFFFLWFIPPLAVRFSSENLSGMMMLLAVSFWIFPDEKRNNLSILVSGFAAGLAFLFRYQSAIFILGFLLWLLLIERPKFKIYLLLFAAMSIPVLSGFIFDRWLYGEWVCVPWNYFKVNLLENKISEFGVKPWYFFFESGSNHMFLPLGIIAWLSAGIYWITRPKSLLTWVSIPFILFHMLVGHKEIRFLFPLLYLLPVFIVQSAVFISRLRVLKLRWIKHSILWSFIALNMLMLVVTITRPMEHTVAVLHRVQQEKKYAAVLFYYKSDPQRPFMIRNTFYKTDGIMSCKLDKKIRDPLCAPSIYKTYFVLDESRGFIHHDPNKYQLLLCHFPKWMAWFNFNHWLDRTENYALYKIR